jgi:hypothetical protein
VLDNAKADRKRRADARSRLARNEKALSFTEFSALAPEPERRAQVISDSRLVQAFEGCTAGFPEDLNDCYSGINAFALLTAMGELAEREKDALDQQAPDQEKNRTPRWTSSASKVQMSAAQSGSRSTMPDLTAKSKGEAGEFLLASQAQFALLTAEDNSTHVGAAYEKRGLPGERQFFRALRSEAGWIFASSGLFADSCAAASGAMGVQSAAPARTGAVLPQPLDCVIVGTKHRVDAKGRKTRRFPNTPDFERIAAEKPRVTGTAGQESPEQRADLISCSTSSARNLTFRQRWRCRFLRQSDSVCSRRRAGMG